MDLPYLTRDFPGIGGAIKQRPEDFFVQELPLYEPSGEGEHVYCEIQKIGLTTFDAVDRIAATLNVPQQRHRLRRHEGRARRHPPGPLDPRHAPRKP